MFSVGKAGGEDSALDAFVGVVGNDAARDELIFGGVGASFDDSFGVDDAHAGEGLELIRGGGVDIE